MHYNTVIIFERALARSLKYIKKYFHPGSSSPCHHNYKLVIPPDINNRWRRKLCRTMEESQMEGWNWKFT